MKRTQQQLQAAAQAKSLTNNLGIYIHIPFCERKCAYCNFFSAFPTDSLKQDYLAALEREIRAWSGKIDREIDSIYIGGGTPSVLKEDIKRVIGSIKDNFCVSENAEITVEMNPAAENEPFLKAAFSAGANRLSIGAQSSNDEMLKLLGRTHTALDTKATVEKAREIGFRNISLDIMLALPKSNSETLNRDIEFLLKLEPQHISAYILKIEEKTAFHKLEQTLSLPDDDAAAEQYLQLCNSLIESGYEHYEISNFCKANYESRHNLKYWKSEEYLGVGPAAHSFINKKRFYYPANLKKFIARPETIDDGSGGDQEEQFMLSLRLSSGADIGWLYKKNPTETKRRVQLLCGCGYITSCEDRIFLTDKGMAVANSIITEFLYEDL